MLKIGLFGVGHLGKIHLKCIQMASETYELVGFYDPSDRNAEKVMEEHDIKRFTNPEELMDLVEVVDIVTPTIYHHQIAKLALEKGKHIFIEKPLTHTVEEAKELIDLASEKGVKVQVGHVERFNPAFLALGEMELNPMFVEGHRLAMFNPRGTDVSVVLDLMIHDLDILLSLVRSEVKTVHATGVEVVSETPDIANARLEFENGCVANLTASRISLKNMRKLRFFQKDAYISLDFLDKNAQVVRMYDEGDPQSPTEGTFFDLDTPSGKKIIEISMPPIEQVNAIKMELESLGHSIMNGTPVKVPIEDGYKALEVAYRIIEEMEKHADQHMPIR
ncbi:MAG: Gfo/Idh/MocA family oxidoreductase [Saprospiraceae bacterium]|nr:Gfo/Idh/MocA family oxidoreductase [Saprospiraceae bacterium]